MHLLVVILCLALLVMVIRQHGTHAWDALPELTSALLRLSCGPSDMPGDMRGLS